MRIAMIGTEAGGGGAGRALWRAAAALNARGNDVDILHVAQNRITPNSILIRRAAPQPGDFAQDDALQRLERNYIAPRRSALSDTLFTADTCGYDLASLSFLRDYDVINIHWTSFFLSVENIGAIVALGRPTVFTLHDLAYFTGGCHYAAGCTGYLRDCANCPQITPDTLRIAPKTRALKQKLFNKPNVAVVAPSAWLTKCAAASKVFAGLPCHHISNPLETDLFAPMDRDAARAALGLTPEDHAILFGAYHGNERRKGFRHMVAALETLREDSRAATAMAQGTLKTLTFGQPPDEVRHTGIPVVSLGYIDNDVELARVYNAADVLVLPSIEDNQPNVMMESLSCGTPVVCFRVGGQPEVVIDGETGFTVAPFDVHELAQRVCDVLFDPHLATHMRVRAPELIRASASFDIVGRELERVFRLLAASVDAPHAAYPALVPAANADGTREAEVRLEYASGLAELAKDLPPVVVAAPPPSPPPPPPLTQEENFVLFHESRDRLLEQLRASPDGQLRGAYRLSRGSSGRRGGFAALALPIVRSYRFNWSTIAGMWRRIGAYGTAALRAIGRILGMGNRAD